jgi:hypothetical protein
MSARARRLCTAAAIASIAAATGCGGGPSAEEKRAELRRWASAVDDICRATRKDIAERGHAKDLLDLERVAEGARADARAAVQRIRRVPVSEAVRPRLDAFMAELEKIEPGLSEMTRATADGSLKRIGKVGVRLADATRPFQRRAKAVGVSECAQVTDFDTVLDAFTAPVYATQLARFETWFTQAFRPLASFDAPTSPDFARHLRRAGNVLEQAEERVEDLYDYRPSRVKSDDDLSMALHRYEDVLNAVADMLRGGRRVLTPVGVKRFDREVGKRRREIRRAITALRKEIGVDPLATPEARPRLEPEQSVS